MYIYIYIDIDISCAAHDPSKLKPEVLITENSVKTSKQIKKKRVFKIQTKTLYERVHSYENGEHCALVKLCQLFCISVILLASCFLHHAI